MFQKVFCFLKTEQSLTFYIKKTFLPQLPKWRNPLSSSPFKTREAGVLGMNLNQKYMEHRNTISHSMSQKSWKKLWFCWKIFIRLKNVLNRLQYFKSFFSFWECKVGEKITKNKSRRDFFISYIRWFLCRLLTESVFWGLEKPEETSFYPTLRLIPNNGQKLAKDKEKLKLSSKIQKSYRFCKIFEFWGSRVWSSISTWPVFAPC